MTEVACRKKYMSSARRRRPSGDFDKRKRSKEVLLIKQVASEEII